jgi:hypothetical protein
MKIIIYFNKSFILALSLSILFPSCSQSNLIEIDNLSYEIYPAVNEIRPDLPSPFLSDTEDEYVIAVTKDDKYAIVPVTLNNSYGICQQLIIDTMDFPMLAKTGLHDENQLSRVKTITGWPADTITELGRPHGLSQSGFMAEDEDIISVIKADNRFVRQMIMTHPQLAKPLFHVLNMMHMDLSLDRWNMARHRWDNIPCFFYNGNKVFVEVYDTKGGQKSIFNDSIEGAFHIKLWHEFDEREIQYLKKHYNHLTQIELDEFKSRLSFLNVGEMQPQYIMRYGFYEGHTYWRACPIAISYIFGFKSLEELDKIFEGNLHEITSDHYID